MFTAHHRGSVAVLHHAKFEKLGPVRPNMVFTGPPAWPATDDGSTSGGSSLGSEASPEQYVRNMLNLFRNISRPKGYTFWLVSDDVRSGEAKVKRGAPGELVTVSWMLAHAMQDEGWQLRDDLFVEHNGWCHRMFVFADHDIPIESKVWKFGPHSDDHGFFPTVPSALVKRCVLLGSKRGDTVLDPFMGTARAARVALATGRNFIGAEPRRDSYGIARKRLAAFCKRGGDI